jgi:hypothetical protein
LDMMTDYIADMATRIVTPNALVTPAFRKFVSQLLSSTRLPHTTILLGMNYLAKRTNSLNAAGETKPSNPDVWRMLTIGLLLGSKFLDDNTFQNRSWSEVSGIAVKDLNTMEHQWLASMDWNIYVNLDESHDYNAWLVNWSDWEATKKRERKATQERLAPLAPINTNVQRQRPYVSTYGFNKTPAREPQSTFHPAYETSWRNQNTNPYPTPMHTPPSAPDSGPLTPPDFMSATGGAPRFNDWSVYQYPAPMTFQQPPPMHPTYIPSHIPAYHTPHSYYGHHASAWDQYDYNSACNPSKQYFGMHGYGGQQIVAG